MLVYCGRYSYIGAGGNQLLKKKQRVDILKWQMLRCRWRSTSYCKDTYKLQSSSKFSLRAAGQRGLMSTKRNPLARNVDHENLKWNCNVDLRWVNPFPRNASRSPKAAVKVRFYIFLLNSCSAKCVPAVWNHAKYACAKTSVYKSSSCKSIPL